MHRLMKRPPNTGSNAKNSPKPDPVHTQRGAPIHTKNTTPTPQNAYPKPAARGKTLTTCHHSRTQETPHHPQILPPPPIQRRLQDQRETR